MAGPQILIDGFVCPALVRFRLDTNVTDGKKRRHHFEWIANKRLIMIISTLENGLFTTPLREKACSLRPAKTWAFRNQGLVGDEVSSLSKHSRDSGCSEIARGMKMRICHSVRIILDRVENREWMAFREFDFFRARPAMKDENARVEFVNDEGIVRGTVTGTVELAQIRSVENCKYTVEHKRWYVNVCPALPSIRIQKIHKEIASRTRRRHKGAVERPGPFPVNGRRGFPPGAPSFPGAAPSSGRRSAERVIDLE